MRAPILSFIIAFLFAVTVPLAYAASSPNDLATIKAAIMADPRAAGMSADQIDRMAAALTAQAQQQGVAADDILWRPTVSAPPLQHESAFFLPGILGGAAALVATAFFLRRRKTTLTSSINTPPQRGASVLAAMVFIALVGLVAGGLQALAPSVAMNERQAASGVLAFDLPTPMGKGSGVELKKVPPLNAPVTTSGEGASGSAGKDKASAKKPAEPGINQDCKPGYVHIINIDKANPRPQDNKVDCFKNQSNVGATDRDRQDKKLVTFSYDPKCEKPTPLHSHQCRVLACDNPSGSTSGKTGSSGSTSGTSDSCRVVGTCDTTKPETCGNLNKAVRSPTKQNIMDATGQSPDSTNKTDMQKLLNGPSSKLPGGDVIANAFDPQRNEELRKNAEDIAAAERQSDELKRKKFFCEQDIGVCATDSGKTSELARIDQESKPLAERMAGLKQKQAQLAPTEAPPLPPRRPDCFTNCTNTPPTPGTKTPAATPPPSDGQQTFGPAAGPDTPSRGTGGIGDMLKNLFGGGGQQQGGGQRGGGQGGGMGGGQGAGGQNPYQQQMCPSSYQCQGNMLVYRTPQCQTQPMQQCQYGCDQTGTQCAQQPAPYGRGTDGQPCPQPPAKPDASQCSAGVWQALSSTNNGCTTGWKCSTSDSPAAKTPTATLACAPQVADVNTPLSITYSCSAGTVTATGFTLPDNQLSGTITTQIAAPPTGSNLITYGITCTNQGLTAGAQCNVQVARPSIVLVANPKVVASGQSSAVGWVTSGMRACTISSPDMPDFTAANANNASINGIVTTSPITTTVNVILSCTTLGGATRSASTTVSVN